MRIIRNNRGVTITELIVVMSIFIIIIMMTSYSFDNIIRWGGQQSKSAGSQIEGIVGLEMLRTDIAHAGYGLPWTYALTPNPGYAEVASSPVPGIDATSFNAGTNPPVAVSGGVTTGGATAGTGYLVIKSALTTLNSSAGRWGFVNYSASPTANLSYIKKIGDPKSDLRGDTDRVITILSSFSATTGAQTKQLVMTDASATGFSYIVPSNFVLSTVDAAYRPADSSQTLLVYGISDTTIRMPFNRSDFYVDFAAAKPGSCNPQTGVLYKAVVDQATAGKYTTPYPLLNCVGDMQIVLMLDKDCPSCSGNLVPHPINSVYVGTLTAAQLSAQLKTVLVYVLTHEGMKDRTYTYPVSSITVGGYGAGRTKDLTTFGTDWMNYRWKVYTLSVNMENLQ